MSMDNAPILIAAVAAIVAILLWRARRGRTPEDALDAAAVERDRDVHRTKAIEAADRIGPGTSGGI